jgi:hypothetical protein
VFDDLGEADYMKEVWYEQNSKYFNEAW